MRPIARRSVIVFILALVLITSCAGDPSTCRELPFTPKAEHSLGLARDSVKFTLVPPCAHLSRLEVSLVIIDQLPGNTVEPRVTFVVERQGQRAFLLSETRALVSFTQIPQGTSPLRITSGDVVADGFIGASGSNIEIAYLRWRVSGVTHELAATVHDWQGHEEIVRLATALMERM